MDKELRAPSTRSEIEQFLVSLSPYLIEVIETQDMGCEIAAVVREGIIQPMAGMLLNATGGQNPLNDWSWHSTTEYQHCVANFLLSNEWVVTSWCELSDDEIEYWYKLILESI